MYVLSKSGNKHCSQVMYYQDWIGKIISCPLHIITLFIHPRTHLLSQWHNITTLCLPLVPCAIHRAAVQPVILYSVFVQPTAPACRSHLVLALKEMYPIWAAPVFQWTLSNWSWDPTLPQPFLIGAVPHPGDSGGYWRTQPRGDSCGFLFSAFSPPGNKHSIIVL